MTYVKPKITNIHGIDLPIAVWLLQDGYKSGRDIAPKGELISVTQLMKPVREQILKRRVNQEDMTEDLSEKIASRMGHGLHDSLEKAWTEGDWKSSMRQLGFSESTIRKIKINPDPESVEVGDIPIYLEQRGFKAFEDVIMTGQLDFAISGAIRDFKTTSTFSFTSDNKDEDFILQGSLYRWIMPHLITRDKMRIEFLFTDWLRYRAKVDPNYPQAKAAHKELELMSIKDTEAWVSNRLAEIRSNASKKQDDMIECTDKELWKDEDTYKYYANPETAKRGGRCSKRFKSHTDAQLHLQEKGKGVIITDPGVVKRCNWCPAFTVCEQRKRYFSDDGENIQHKN